MAAPSLNKLLVRWVEWFKYWWHQNHTTRQVSPSHHDEDNDERPLLSRDSHRSSSYGTARQMDEESQQRPRSIDPPRSQSNRRYYPSTPLLNSSRPTSRKSGGWFSILTIYAVVFIGWAVVAFYSTAVPPIKSGLSKSRPCGVWSLRPKVSGEEQDKDDLVQTQKEIRAGQYARDCYGDQSIVRPGRCNFFENQTISYQTFLNQPCPFKDSSYCNGAYTAVRFSTGPTSARVLGMNSPNLPTFTRTTTCVPLNMRRGFVKQVPPDDQFRFDYFLGQTNGSRGMHEYTFRQFGDPFKWDVPAYSLSAYESTPYPDHDYWLPISGLRRQEHTYLTIMFIASCRIIYTGPSQDYIFHSDEPFSNDGKYWNPDPRARPLACVDSTEVCSSDQNCSKIDQEHRKHEKEYEFVRSALRRSTIFQSIRFRLGTALVAQESVGDFISRPLADDQWIVESRALFETSLARIQYDALDIATGIGHNKDPGPYQEETLEWARGHMCDMYKFQLPQGYTNIDVLETVFFLLLVLLLIVLALETKVSFNREKKLWFRGRYMIYELVLWRIYQAARFVSRPLRALSRWSFAQLSAFWHRVTAT